MTKTEYTELLDRGGGVFERKPVSTEGPPTAVAHIATGTYTGDGTTSQAITGLGFQPKFVWIVQRQTLDGTAINISPFTTDVIVDDNAAGGAIDVKNSQFETNQIISLDADGFTVDDDSTDADPNTNTQVYNYLAIG